MAQAPGHSWGTRHVLRICLNQLRCGGQETPLEIGATVDQVTPLEKGSSKAWSIVQKAQDQVWLIGSNGALLSLA